MPKAYLPIPPLSEKDKARFWSYVEKTETCWIWNGTRKEHGYGIISLGGRNGHYYRVHRVAYAIAFGSTPEHLEVMHDCDQPWCIRHIRLGTHLDNMMDCKEKGRNAKGEEFGKIVSEFAARGEDRPQHKLTNDEVLEIRRLLAAGTMGKDLAKEYDVNVSCISKIKNRRLWSHI